MNKDIEQVVVQFKEDKKLVFRDEEPNQIMEKIGNMEDIDVVSIQFKDNETVNFTSGLLMCDMGEIHKGISSPGLHMSSCLTKKDAINEIKRLLD